MRGRKGIEDEPADASMHTPARVLGILTLIVVFFTGLTIVLTSNPLLKTSMWFRVPGLVMMLASAYVMYRMAGRHEMTHRESPSMHRLPAGFSIAERFLAWSTTALRERSSLILPVAGALLVDAVFYYNWRVYGVISYDTMGTYDFVAIAMGLMLVAYNYVPDRFGWTRDFFTFFLIVSFSILVVPRVLLDIMWGGGQGSSFFTEYLLVRPVHGVVGLMGIESHTQGDILFFTLKTGDEWAVGIGEACSGIYTATIFIAAFVSFVLMEYQRFDRLVAFFLAVGVLTAYLANVLRISLIVWISYRYDTQDMLVNHTVDSNFWFAHTNLGWIIFMLWIIPFWYLVFRYMLKDDPSRKD